MEDDGRRTNAGKWDEADLKETPRNQRGYTLVHRNYSCVGCIFFFSGEALEWNGPSWANDLSEQRYLGQREIDDERDKNNVSIWFLNSLCWQVATPCLSFCSFFSATL